MNERLFAPVVGVILGWISFETLQSVLFSLLIAFLGGIAAWFGHKMCDKIQNWWNKKNNVYEKMD